jgi:hypothetical protein
VCEHIARYYAHVAAEPCAFWTFDIEELRPANPIPDAQSPQAYAVPSDTGDDCHRNIHHLSDNQADKIRRRWTEASLRICVGGKSEPFTVDRVIALINEYFPDPQ